MAGTKSKATGYDKYVDWKLFSIPVILFFGILFLPTPYGMKDVGVEYRVGPKAVIQFISKELFHNDSSNVEQWQLVTAQMMEKNLQMGALTKKRFLKRDEKWCKSQNIPVTSNNLKKSLDYIDQKISDEKYQALLESALKLRTSDLKYEGLTGKDKEAADGGAWHIKVAIAMLVFVVFCFVTECIPLPGVALLHWLDTGLHGSYKPQGGGSALLGRRLLVYHGKPHVCCGLCQNRRG
jgi:hypothetical protein